MIFNIVTIFPEFFDSALCCGLLGKAVDQGMVKVRLINPRDFTLDRHRSVDDRPYGGGPGMVMTLPPLAAALRSLESTGKILLLSPKGRPLDHAMAVRFSREQSLTLICGRYEGIDARLEDLFHLETVSVGNVVLNGGETAALHLLEAAARLLPGFLGHDESVADESFARGVLEHPHYSRPEEFEGCGVPEVLLSGDHAKIAAWRREGSLADTLDCRPELLHEAPLSASDLVVLRRLNLTRCRISKNCHLALVHAPVLNKHGQIGTVSLTNLDIHDIARVSRTYDMGGYYVCTPLQDQRRLGERLVRHWTNGPGREGNVDRADALALVRLVESLDHAVAGVREQTGQEPLLVGTSAASYATATMTVAQVREALHAKPVLLVLGTGHGLASEVLERCAGVLRPIRFYSAYNHLSVRSAAAIIVDRLLGDSG
ncbi:MAG TPA: tRNA (guanosine(37)-N1)-methyltransferase TrmD [Desulfonatronum sp.]|nr:tRNA (guanosine(37)-N1)-methyltransferase TrmD [Desulfonatronum sp.]